MRNQTVIAVDQVSKKFCLDLKRSLWYGMTDIASDLMGRQPTPVLRKDEFWAVSEVSFALERGDCLGLIGHNGAGKSTLLKMMNGLIHPDKGEIRMHGHIGALIELGAGFNPVLTGRENVYTNGAILGFSRREIDHKLDEIVDFAELERFIDAPVQGYSSGMRVRLGFAVAAQMECDILLLDEVLAVGDIQFQAKCLNRIGEMRKSGTTIILVSHQKINITRYCNKVMLLEQGHQTFFGDTAQGMARYEASLAQQKRIASKHQTGNGSLNVRVLSMRLSHPDGRPCTHIQSGDPLLLMVDTALNAQEETAFRIEITIRDRYAILHQYSEDRLFSLHPEHSPTLTLECTFPQIPSNGPELYFTVTLWNRDFTELFDWREQVSVKVHPVERSTGLVHLPVRITTSPPPVE
jgi:lipopolysaccharide transport system ATP-binding protein